MVRLAIRRMICAAMCLMTAASLVGCQNFHVFRSPQPELKPADQPEILATAPKERRFATSQYPDVAFRNLDNFRRPSDGLTTDFIQPAKSGMGMSPTGMPAGYR